MPRPPAPPQAFEDLAFELDVSAFDHRRERRVPLRAFWVLPGVLALGFWAGGQSAPPARRPLAAPRAHDSARRATAAELRGAPRPMFGGASPIAPSDVAARGLGQPATARRGAEAETLVASRGVGAGVALPEVDGEPVAGAPSSARGASTSAGLAASAPRDSLGQSSPKSSAARVGPASMVSKAPAASATRGRAAGGASGVKAPAASATRARAATGGGAVHDRLAELAPKAGALGSAALKSAGAQRAWDGQWAQALALYTSAAKAAPADPDAWFGIGLCQAELGQPRFAAKTVRYALTLAPDHALAHVLAGFLAQDRGHLAEARSHYERSLALQPDGLFAAELASVLEHLPQAPSRRAKQPAVVLGRVAMAKSGGAR